MTEKQKDAMRKQLVKQFSRNNRYWTYNGTFFEMSGGFSFRELDVWVTFRNRESGLEMSMQYHGAMLYGEWAAPTVERSFTGEDRFGQAIDAIADYLERLADTVVPLQAERAERSQEYSEKICMAVRAIASNDQ